MKIQTIISAIILCPTTIKPLSATESIEPAFLIEDKGRLVLREALVIEDSAYVSASAFSGVLDA